MQVLSRKKSNYFAMIMRIAFPVIIQGLVFQLQTIVDKAFLGKIDTNFLTAVGIAQLPFQCTVDALIAFCTGLTIIVAKNCGAGKDQSNHDSVNAAIAYNMLFSFLLFLFWFHFSDKVFLLMNVNDNLMPYCKDYIQIMSFILIVYSIDMSLQAALQGMGKTKPIMYIGFFKVFLNILLAWILIFGKLGFPPMYVRGAAFATMISNIAGTLILTAYFILSKELSANIKLHNMLRFRWSLYKEVIRLGLPTGAEYLMWNISNLILISILNKQGVEVVAVYTITCTVEIFVYMIFNGIAKATLTLVGNSIGAGSREESKRIMTHSICYSMLFVLLFCIMFAVIPKPILSIFSNDKALINMSVLYLIVKGITMFPKALNVVVGCGNRAEGDVKWMLFTQIIGSIFVVSFSYTLVYGFHAGVAAIYLTLFLDELIRAILNTIKFYHRNAFRGIPFITCKHNVKIQPEE
jgi:putative MATE family efflux protein